LLTIALCWTKYCSSPKTLTDTTENVETEIELNAVVGVGVITMEREITVLEEQTKIEDLKKEIRISEEYNAGASSRNLAQVVISK